MLYNVAPDEITKIDIIGSWGIVVRTKSGLYPNSRPMIFTVSPPSVIEALDELHPSLPVWNPDQPGWARERVLREMQEGDCTARLSLETSSLRITPDGKTSESFLPGVDFEIEREWGTIGRLPGGKISQSQSVRISYRYYKQRLDSVIQSPGGRVYLREGTPHLSTPVPPPLNRGETRLANIWIPGGIKQLTPDDLFPILEHAYPRAPSPMISVAERFFPVALRRLRSGQPLRILAWGDSVTAGYPGASRWQDLFRERILKIYPDASITLDTLGWGAHNMKNFLDAPPGHPFNYREKVLGLRPDLVISEFLNDMTLSPEQTQEQYTRVKRDFDSIGAEWIILTPHYVTPDWMGLTRQRDIDQDPRPYVSAVRSFALQKEVALADASRRYGRLWRQGIPYTTLMVNTANHPNTVGMMLFVDALMELFPPGSTPQQPAPMTVAPTTVAPTTVAPMTVAPTTVAPTTVAPTTVAPTTVAPTTVIRPFDSK